jgi:hypothetical protein
MNNEKREESGIVLFFRSFGSFVFLFSALGFLFFALNGCAQCMLMRSEYYDMTGQVFTAKAADAEIPIYEGGQEITRPYAEIGVVKVIAQPKTSRQEVEEELRKRARLAGADALIDMKFEEDKENKAWFCGRLMSTRHNAAASARAVKFTDTDIHGTTTP